MENKVYTKEDIKKVYKDVRKDFGIMCKRGNMEGALNFIGMLSFLVGLGYFTEEDFKKEKNEFKKDVIAARRSNGLKC